MPAARRPGPIRTQFSRAAPGTASRPLGLRECRKRTAGLVRSAFAVRAAARDGLRRAQGTGARHWARLDHLTVPQFEHQERPQGTTVVGHEAEMLTHGPLDLRDVQVVAAAGIGTDDRIEHEVSKLPAYPCAG